jgi:hypothetical protein
LELEGKVKQSATTIEILDLWLKSLHRWFMRIKFASY